MSTMIFPTATSLGQPALGKRRLQRFGPLVTIGLLHGALFYAMYSGRLSHAAKAVLPAATYISFITPPAPPQASLPAPPETFALSPPPSAIVLPPQEIKIASLENAITKAAPAPQPAAAVVAAAAEATLARAAPPAAPATGPKTISSGVEYIQAPQPIYPSISKRLGEQGKVMLRILINENGQPEQVTIAQSSGSARLDEAGRQAALRALFKPHIEDGRAVAVFVIVPLNFQLTT